MTALRELGGSISAVLFDFDGVLYGSQGSFYAAWKELGSKFYRWSPKARDLTPGDIIRRFEACDAGRNRESLKLIYQMFADLIPGRFRRLVFFARMGKYPRYDRVIGKLIPGVKDSLQELHGYGIPLAIVTNSMRDRVEGLAKSLGIAPYLSAMISRDDLRKYAVKPSPFPILLCLLKLKQVARIRRDNVFFVGDLPTDVQSAHGAKVKSIAVTSGHATREELENENPTYIVGGVKDIFTLPEFQEYKARHQESHETVRG